MITSLNPAVSSFRTNNKRNNKKDVNFQWRIPQSKLEEALKKNQTGKIDTIMGSLWMNEKEAKQEIDANRVIMKDLSAKFPKDPIVGSINKIFGFDFSKK